MTDKPHVTMSPDELAVELLTTGQHMSGGRAEAERLLQQVKDRHAHQLAEQQRNHWMPRPPGETADYVRGLDDGFDKAADLIDPKVEAQR